MGRAERIQKRLEKELPQAQVAIEDETPKHIGHKEMLGHSAPSETHLKIHVVSECFAGMRFLERNRKVNDLILDEFSSGLHAVNILCDAPGETSNKDSL
jgi:stress-induced morphogen